MNLKFSILIGLIASLTISCSTLRYQVSSFSSSDVEQDFTFENDDLKITYNFWENHGQLFFTILNKTEGPIFIDWEHSNFIFNGYSYDYFQKKKTIKKQGVYQGVTIFGYSQAGAKPSRSKGKSSNNSAVSEGKTSIQIPPDAYVKSEPINLAFPWIKTKKDTLIYSAESTPLTIRTYIAYSKSTELSEQKYVDNTFWIDKTIVYKANAVNEKANKSKFFTSGRRPAYLENTLLIAVIVSSLILITNTTR